MKSFLLLFQLFSIIFNKEYKYLDYDEITTTFTELSQNCSQYIQIDTSQSRYNLPFAHECGPKPCSTLIVFMTEFTSFSVERPQVNKSNIL